MMLENSLLFSDQTVHTYPQNPRYWKAAVAGQYTGVSVKEAAGFQMGVTNKTPEFLAKFPLGKVPAAETPEGPLFESNAIARYGTHQPVMK